MGIEYAGLIGLYGGAIAGLSGWYFGRKKAKKENGFDEMHNHITKTARSFSWFATLATIYILFTLLMIGFDLDVAPVLGIIMLVQLSSWGISSAVLHYYMSVGINLNINLITGFSIILLSTVFFITVAIILSNWIFLFCPIPFGIIGFYFMKQSSSNEGVN